MFRESRELCGVIRRRAYGGDIAIEHSDFDAFFRRWFIIGSDF